MANYYLGYKLQICLYIYGSIFVAAVLSDSSSCDRAIMRCTYTEERIGFVVTCDNLTEHNLTCNVASLPNRTTHLLLTTALREDTYETIPLTFNHLPNLEVLLLDTAGGMAGIKIQLNSSALQSNSNLRVFKSRVPLKFTQDVFHVLGHIEELVLTGTEMDWDFVPNFINESLTNMTSLISLSLRRFSRYWHNSSHLAYFECDKIFGSIKQNSIKELDISRNGIHSISLTFHRIFKSLKSLDASYNLLTTPYWKAEGMYPFYMIGWTGLCLSLPTLNHIDISGQGRKFSRDKLNIKSDLNKTSIYTGTEKQIRPDTSQTPGKCGCKPQNDSTDLFCRCLQTFGIKSVSVAREEVFEALQRWKIVVYSDIYLINNSIEYIDFSDMKEWHIKNLDMLRVFGLDKLKYLNFQNNEIGKFNKFFFRSMTSLKVLLLAGNSLKQSINENTTTLNLNENKNLEVIDLSNNGLKYIPYDFFSSFRSLKYLNLSHNSLSHLKINFTNLHRLDVINVSYNNLSEVSKEMQHQLDNLVETKDLILDLTSNVLLCGCENLQFLYWFQSTNVNFTNRDYYICAHPFEGMMTIKDIKVDKLHNSCFPSYTKIVVTSVVVTFISVMTIVITTTVYCKRWRLRYWWYITQKGWRQLSNNTDPLDYDHDVFVAYNWQDSPWVHGPLLQEMEEKRGLNLCIHQRDFIPGEVLEEIIAEKIQKSRKTLLVLTPHFVDSNWCHFELHMARNQLFEKGQDVLVLVILKPIPSGSVNGTLYELLKKKLYLEWPEDAEGHDLFWNKLSDALAKDSSQCRPFD